MLPTDRKPRVKRTRTPEQALAALMRLASRAEKSSGDARRLMKGWEIAPADQERILQRLQHDRFIDDERFAAAFVREKCNLSGWGARKIREALRRKGIAPALIDAALAGIDPDASRGRLEEMLRRRLRTVRGRDDFDRKAKLIRYGLSLGYDYAAVRDEADRLIHTQDPCDDLF